MMNDDCRRTASRLTSYVDDALPASERADVERHLGACPPCRHAALHESGAREVLRRQARALSDEPLPPGLRSRCEALALRLADARSGQALRLADARSGQAPEHAAPPAPVFAVRRFAPLTTVMVIVIAFFTFSLATHRSDTVLAAQLTADHAKCFLFSKSNSPDRDARLVERMLQDDYGWDVHVPPSSSENGVQLIGARRCLYADGSIPHVMYRAAGHDMSLFVLDGVNRSADKVVSLGHHSRIWSAGRRTYVLVWPVAAGDLSAATRYVMEEAR